ncbi:MAG TPA: hypothetical protein VK072_05290 [Candidatus Avamphibacillus sp.]|nr:hypothetical protein [Candidatus Avamphibacillus sp.]
MKKYHIAQDFSLLALTGQRSGKLTNAKRVSLRCMAAAAILELYLDGYFKKESDSIIFERDNGNTLEYHDIVLDILLGKSGSLKETLPEFITKVKKLSKSNLEDIEDVFVTYLNKLDALEEIPSLLSCDLEFETAGISVKEYQSHPELYTKLIKSLRAETLHENQVTDEGVIMFWLLKESGTLYDIFKDDELEGDVAQRFDELLESHPLAKDIFPVSIQRTNESFVKKFLDFKKETMSTASGAGVNFIFPFFERSQAVFIDTESYFADKEDRLRELKSRLEKHNVPYTLIREGAVPLIKISGVLYEAVPYTKQYRMPVHGIQLRRYVEDKVV